MTATDATAAGPEPVAGTTPLQILAATFVRLVPVLLVLFAGIVAALPPLHEMDLAQHLATGEWIVRHRAVPFVEPFAWTRAGQPYFAYSWLPDVLFFTLLRTFGPLALHILEGSLAAGAVAAAFWAGRRFRWSTATCAALGVIHLALLWGLANTLRPQQFLFVLLPLSWGIAADIEWRGASVGRLLALAGISMLAANSHIFFVLTAVPIVYFALADGNVRKWLLGAVALVIGWLLSPYGLVWPRVFALNFGHNALLGRPPSVAEFVPGFEYALQRPGVIVTVAALLAAPVVLATLGETRRRITLMIFWTAGLIAFAYAGRLVLIWWVLALPLAGLAIDRAVARLNTAAHRVYAAVGAGGLAAIALLWVAPPIRPVFWLFEGDTVHRMLPRGGEDPALWLPSWLLCHTRPGASGRIFTEFNYGSELNWRLPGYSPSIDGRTIFPDSDAVEFAYWPYGRARKHATTWQHADLALLDRSFWLAPILDSDANWVLLAQGRRTTHTGMGALWAKREWWRRWGTTEGPVALDVHPGDKRGICEVTGVFPAR